MLRSNANVTLFECPKIANVTPNECQKNANVTPNECQKNANVTSIGCSELRGFELLLLIKRGRSENWNFLLIQGGSGGQNFRYIKKFYQVTGSL